MSKIGAVINLKLKGYGINDKMLSFSYVAPFSISKSGNASTKNPIMVPYITYSNNRTLKPKYSSPFNFTSYSYTID